MATRGAKVGELVTLRKPGGDTFVHQAGAPCDIDRGHWACSAHPTAALANNLSASWHFGDPGEHVEVWICHEHGPEAPYVIVGVDGPEGLTGTPAGR